MTKKISTYHLHTTFCDGKNTAEEMLLEAIRRKCPEIGFSVHSPFDFKSDWAIRKERVKEYVRTIEDLKEKYGDKIAGYHVTYGISGEIISAVIAGGSGAIVNASEGCEDSREKGISAFDEKNCNENDLIIGISANGRAPFVVAFMEKAKERGCKVAALVNNLDTEMAKIADIAIEALTGAEVIKGSTRMKAGSSQKMILNMFSTAVCVKMGYTWQNYMVRMKPSNSKLMKRAIAMVCEILDIKPSTAEELLIAHDWDIHASLLDYSKK
jgi:N-acetylmuramic acid 6-phosphate etherase